MDMRAPKVMSQIPPLVPSHIAEIAPYEPGKPIEELQRELGDAWPKNGAIKLASNENPYGPSPKVLAAIRSALSSIHFYPDGSAFRLRARLAAYHGVSDREVVVGAGSNELIELLVHAFVGDGEEVLAPAYSFICYRLASQSRHRRFVEAETGPHFAIDAERLLSAVTPRTRLLFLANPNNPTGAYLPRPEFELLVRSLPPHVLLAVDEAYFEYARSADYPDALRYLSERERLISLRTFSKIHGLAGLRVGYGISHPQVIDYLNRVRMAFNVASVAQEAAIAALDDREHLEKARADNAVELERLTDALSRQGLAVLPSQGNFVLLDVGQGRQAKGVYQDLLREGVIVRPLLPYGLPRHLRITVGTKVENDRLLEALSAALG
jgi:histidinol-phosphate aminotransferase